MIFKTYCRPYVILSAVFLLVSCPIHQRFIPNVVQHYAVLPNEPDVDCVWNRLMNMSKPKKVLTIRDAIPAGVNHRFHLDAEQPPFTVSVFFGDDGSYRYSATSNAQSGTLVALQAAKQALVEVDAELSGQCGLGDIIGIVQEACAADICDQLSDM